MNNNTHANGTPANGTHRSGRVVNGAIKPVGGDRCGGVSYVATIMTPMSTELDNSLSSMEGTEATGPVAHAKKLAADAKAKAREVKGAFVYRASEVGDSIAQRTSHAKDIISNKASNLTSTVRDADYHGMVMSGRRTMRQNPPATLMVAAGIGIALGLLMGRRH